MYRHVKKVVNLTAILLLFACGDDRYKFDAPCSDQMAEGEFSEEGMDTIKIVSDYDMSTVDAKDRREFKENLAKIEKKHGEQWDFCTCVIKNDSINRAFSEPLPDDEFDRLALRLDEIDKRCKAFLTQSSNVTPEERSRHEKKVKNCLKEAGTH